MQLYMDFSVILGVVTLICGLIWGVDVWIFRPKRLSRVKEKGLGEIDPKDKKQFEPKTVEYARSFFPFLLVIFIFRSFVGEPFRIPSGSMKPTLLEGDFIGVNKYTFGLRLPLFATKLVQLNNPKRGDVLVFRYPNDPSVNFIKRVVGIPGDRISYKDKVLYINAEPVKQEFLGSVFDTNANGQGYPAKHFKEMLPETPHSIFTNLRPGKDVEEKVVPEGMYFMMGDNRDNSGDSREWGFVPDKLVLGKAIFVWLSWDPVAHDIRWRRIGKKIN